MVRTLLFINEINKFTLIYLTGGIYFYQLVRYWFLLIPLPRILVYEYFI